MKTFKLLMLAAVLGTAYQMAVAVDQAGSQSVPEWQNKLEAVVQEVSRFLVDSQAALMAELKNAQGFPRRELMVVHDKVELYIKKLDAAIVAISVLDKPLAITNRDAYKFAESLLGLLKNLKAFIIDANTALKSTAERLP
jgi:hypothetical protein